MFGSIKNIFKGAVETVSNYAAAYGANTAERLGSTLQDKQYALKYGPVGSTAYNTALSNRYLVKNPSSIVYAGSAARAGVAAKAGSVAQKAVQAARGVAKPAIKNLPGFIQSTVQKAVTQAIKDAPVQRASGVLSTAFGRVLAVGGLVTGATLAVTNTLDFYNWNGPIQTALKNKFPWLFAARQNLDTGIKKPTIKRMTPTEVWQLQRMIYDATGKLLTGEELRKAIEQVYGIIVIEEKATKGGPVGLLGPMVKGTSSSIKIKPQIKFMIENAEDLKEATMNEVSAFIQALPGRMTFEHVVKATYVDADGKRRKGNYAVVKVYIVNKKGTRTEVAELALGTVPPNIGTATPLSGVEVAKQIQSVLKSTVSQNTGTQMTTPPMTIWMGPGVAEDDIRLEPGAYGRVDIMGAPAGTTRSPASAVTEPGFGVFGNGSIAPVRAPKPVRAPVQRIHRVDPSAITKGGFDITPSWKVSFYTLDTGKRFRVYYNPANYAERLIVEGILGDVDEVITRTGQKAETALPLAIERDLDMALAEDRFFTFKS